MFRSPYFAKILYHNVLCQEAEALSVGAVGLEWIFPRDCEENGQLKDKVKTGILCRERQRIPVFLTLVIGWVNGKNG